MTMIVESGLAAGWRRGLRKKLAKNGGRNSRVGFNDPILQRRELVT